MNKLSVVTFAALCSSAFAGPRTPVADFFAKHVDTSIPELSSIPELMEKGDVKAAEKVFADHVRANLQTEKINADWVGRKYPPRALSNLTAKVRTVMDYTLTSCGTPHHFADHKVDWLCNPTYNQYVEWTYQLNRFDCVVPLGEYYLATNDEAAATVWIDLMESWFDQSPVPEKGVSSYATKNWRTLDAACRIGNWNRLFAVFARSPQVSDEFITRYGISVWEHGWRLRNNTTQGNWLLGELSALLQIAVLHPYLRDASEWRSYAQGRMASELERQVYPDGFHYELTTAYHGGVTANYLSIGQFYTTFGLELPKGLDETLERMFEVYIRLCRPSRRTPSINDGEEAPVPQWCYRASLLFPARADFRWFMTGGREGTPPDFLSCAFPYAGAIVFRDSWDVKGVWAYMDASPFGRGHQHEDKLNFILDAYGKTMLIEGGNYFYDSSPMRKYAISTRAHNTVRIDGCDQSTGRTYRWRDEDIKRKADMEFSVAPGRDRARASFSAGYGPRLVKAVHDRTVLFLKDIEGCTPFFVVVDRLTPPPDEKSHKYEILWHFEDCALTITNTTFAGDFGKGVGLFAATSATNAVLTDKKGQTKPELQGWKPLWINGPHKDQPIPTVAVEGGFSNATRIATVLYPYDGNNCPLRGIRASADPADTEISLLFADGSERKIDEAADSTPPQN